MMGRKAVEPKLYVSFSLDAAVPAGHLVRRLAAAVDLDFVRALVRRRYSHTGQPSVDPVVLFKLWLLGYLFNITSERRLCEEAGLNLAWRWFLGYELDEAIPDHSVLSKARRRFGLRVYEQFFGRVVQLCERAGLVQGDVLFVDSTLTQANASSLGLRSRSLLQQTLRPPAEYAGQLWLVNDDADGDDDSGGRGSPAANERKDDGRRSHVNAICVSPTDPDAQMFKKPGKTPVLSHKVHFLVDGGRHGVVTAVAVRGSCEPDGRAVGALLDKHHAVLQRPARELVSDRGYGSEAAVKECRARGVQPLLGQGSSINTHGGLSRDHFTYIADRDVYLCPRGEELKLFRRQHAHRAALYKPKRGTCAACPLRAACVAGRGDRGVTRGWEAESVEEMRARSATPRSRSLLRRRQVLERINADAKEKHGMARAQFRGRRKMQIQALLTAAVLNLKQLAARGPAAQAGWAVMAEALHDLEPALVDQNLRATTHHSPAMSGC